MAWVVRFLTSCGLYMTGIAVPAWGADEEFLDGLLEPHQVVEISSQVPGIVDEVLVERGDRVEVGQVLARLKSELARLAVEQAKVRVEFSKRQAKRNEELFRKNLISDQEKDQLETDIRINELALEEAFELLGMRTIRTPVQGVVVERATAPGEYVGTEYMFTVARVDPLNVEVIVPRMRLGTLRLGMVVEVRPEAPVGGVFKGKIVVIDQVLDAASGTFGVRVGLPNPDLRLSAGLKCKVRFISEEVVKLGE